MKILELDAFAKLLSRDQSEYFRKRTSGIDYSAEKTDGDRDANLGHSRIYILNDLITHCSAFIFKVIALLLELFFLNVCKVILYKSRNCGSLELESPSYASESKDC